MNEKEKFEQLYRLKFTSKERFTSDWIWKWIEQHDQRILDGLWAYCVEGKKALGFNEQELQTLKIAMSFYEQFMKERNLTPQNKVSGETLSPKEELGAQKAIKEWENIPTVYEERKTMSKSIEEILEKYGIATRIVTTSSEDSLSYTQEIATDLIEELTALIEPNDRETILREFTNALENEVYFKGSKTTNTLIAVFADEFRPIICRVLDKFLKEKK